MDGRVAVSRAALRGYAVTVAVLIVVYDLIPPARPELVAVIGALGTAAVLYGVVRLRPVRLGAWLLIAFSMLMLTLGMVAATVSPDALTLFGYPEAADVAYLCVYLPLAIGLLWLGRPRSPSRDWPLVLDTIALSLGGSVVVWILLVRPAVGNLHLTGLGEITAVASGVGFVIVLAAGTRVFLAWRTNLVLTVLSIAVGFFLYADFRYALSVAHGGIFGPGIGLGSLTFIGLCGLAALVPSMARIDVLDLGRHSLGPGRIAIMAVALLIAPSALLVEATSGTVTTGVAIAIVSGATGIVMVIRLSLVAGTLRRRAVRERALVGSSRALMVADTDEDVVAALRTALAAMLDPVGPGEVRLSDLESPDDPTVSPRTTLRIPVLTIASGPIAAHSSTGPIGGRDRTGELTVPLNGPGHAGPHPPVEHTGGSTLRAVVFRGPATQLSDLTAMLEALGDQAGLALARISLEQRLRSDDRERYFRSLVLTSRDVTLISRRGRIDYATPSARPLFGYDIRGRRFDAVVQRDDQVNASDTPAEDRAEGWSSVEEGAPGYVEAADGTVRAVEVRRRDLTDDPTVNGVVTTLRDVTAERELRDGLAHRASHDGLTGLANAELFRDQVRADRVAAGRGGAMGAVLFVDLDDFKRVNDTYGHEIGDGLLMTVAHRIRSALRSGDLAARLGGDEFAVLLRDVPDADSARAAAQRITDSLAPSTTVAGVSLDIGASIGLAIASTPAEYDTLMGQADAALYTAKADGKGRWRQYRQGMTSAVRRRSDVRAELEAAIRDETLTLHYQPVVELTTGRTVGFEALIRNGRPRRFTVDGPNGIHSGGAKESPDGAVEGTPDRLPATATHLVRQAEEHGLIVQLGEWVLSRALADAALFNPPAQPRSVFVAVNISATQLRQPGFVDAVRAQLAVSGIDPAALVLEITESLLVREDERAWAYLSELRADGVKVAIDDYGTGYASLSYLRQPGIDAVKIDRSFVEDVTSPRTRLLLEAVIDLTGKLGLVQIAEGIEDRSTRDQLIEMGCRYGQGYLFAEPMPAGEAVAWSAREGSPA